MDTNFKIRLLKELNSKLEVKDINLDIIAAGGFALEYYGFRGTLDIDGFFYTDSRVEELIAEVGRENNIFLDGEEWLNNNVQSLNTVPDIEFTEIILKESNLTMRIVDLEYLFIMKIVSGREKDKIDCVDIIKSGKINVSEENAYKQMKKIFRNYGKSYSQYEFEVEEILIDSFGFKWIEDNLNNKNKNRE